MNHAQSRRLEDDQLVGGEIELHAGQAPANSPRPPVVHPAFDGRPAPFVLVMVEPQLVGGHLDAALLVDPAGDVAEGGGEKAVIELGGVGQREVEILREAVGLEVDLLQAGPTLEDPGAPERLVVVDAGDEPAQDIVFFSTTSGPRDSSAPRSWISRASITGRGRRSLPLGRNDQTPAGGDPLRRQGGIELRPAG